MARVIRKRVRRSRIQKKLVLQLTSLMDALIIIVVFLLKSYGISAMGVPHVEELELPLSNAPEKVGEGVVLIIAKDQIYVDNKSIMEFIGKGKEEPFKLPGDVPGSALSIAPVFDALKEKRDNFEVLASRSEDPEKAEERWRGDIFIQADKAVPYELLRKVMYTASIVGYKRFRLTVQKQVE